MTRYQLFVNEWKDCRRCSLCETRQKVVLARGKIPCDVLFLGEAPGASEDVIGRPFVGPAGKLLDTIIARSLPDGVTHAFTNMICCIPRDEDGDKTAMPDDDSVEACTSRLQQFVRLADPRLIVTVGAFAEGWLDDKYKRCIRFHKPIPEVTITHPAAILRQNAAMRGFAIQRCIVNLTMAVEEMLEARSPKRS